MKYAHKLSAKSVSITLVLIATASAAAGVHEKILESRTTTLIVSNEDEDS